MGRRVVVRGGALAAGLAAIAVLSLVPLASGTLAARGVISGWTSISRDQVADSIGSHSTEVQPSLAVSGETLVAVFEVGRIYDGGASAIGWARSTNGGSTWSHGLVPLTVQSGQATTAAGPLTRAAYPVVAYDAKFKTWVVSAIGMDGNAHSDGVFVSRSTNGATWSQPIAAHLATVNEAPDRSWIGCDEWPTSAGYGNCYATYVDSAASSRLQLMRSTDGGQSWGAPSDTGDVTGETTLAAAANPGDTNIKVTSVSGFVAGEAIDVDVDPSGGQETVTIATVGTSGSGGTGLTISPALAKAHPALAAVAASGAAQVGVTSAGTAPPVVQPPPAGSPPGAACGRVVVPFGVVSVIDYVTSSDCGAHWSARTFAGVAAQHAPTQMRTSLVPVSTMDSSGEIFTAWQTRSFRIGTVSSTPNDIAFAEMPAPTGSAPAPSYGPAVRVPSESDNSVANPNDHFLPAIAVDPATSGAGAHLALFYYTYPTDFCVYADPGTANQCDLQVAYMSSVDGGANWSSPSVLAHQTLAQIVRTAQGLMVGDYSAAVVPPAGPTKGSAIALLPLGAPGTSTDNALAELMYVPTPAAGITGLHIRGGLTPAGR